MNPIVKKNGTTYGIMLGVFSILLTTVIYVVDLELFTSMWVGITSIIISLAIGIVLLSKTKKDMNGIITFKEAFTTYFLAAVIGTALSILFTMLLFNVVDTEAKTTLNDISARYTLEVMEKWGAPAEAIDETRAALKGTDNYSPLSLLKGMAISLVLSAILALILALIFKSKPAYKE